MLFYYTQFGGRAVAGPGFKSAMPGFQGILKNRWSPLAKERQRLIDERSR